MLGVVQTANVSGVVASLLDRGSCNSPLAGDWQGTCLLHDLFAAPCLPDFSLIKLQMLTASEPVCGETTNQRRSQQAKRAELTQPNLLQRQCGDCCTWSATASRCPTGSIILGQRPKPQAMARFQ